MQTHTVTVTTPGEHEILVARRFDAPRPLVWRCWTEPALLERWLTGAPGWSLTSCLIDLRVGGKYRFVWRGPDGQHMGMGGVYTAIDAPVSNGQTQIYDQDWTGGETLVTLTLADEGARTLSTTHVRYASQTARDFALSTGMVEGMGAGYMQLDQLLTEFN